jgi:molecular chaperone GrpE
MTENDERFVDRRASARMNREPEGENPAGDEVAQDAAPDAGEDWKAKADQYYANWQRSAADFINYKRRVDEERKEVGRLASAALVINLLPVYDDFDRAVKTVDAKLAGLNWVQGVEAIYRKFGNLLESMGVQEVSAEGEQFDPEQHEAVGQSPGPQGRVVHVAQKGYMLGGKVIRPAMVIVGAGEGGGPQGGVDTQA